MAKTKTIRLESSLDGFEAWIELPKEWLIQHTSEYGKAYNDYATLNHDASMSMARFVGALHLLVIGAITADIPGIDLTEDTPDLMKMSSKTLHFLVSTAVTHPTYGIIASMNVPFIVASSSLNGSKTTGAKKMTIPD